mmetsp:Transcript_107773/g.292176  ORF Transcript_107773/g.292176 Transcript_107773/m.292176 type:complete len:104 (-) Transcript_107773:22-333(-)
MWPPQCVAVRAISHALPSASTTWTTAKGSIFPKMSKVRLSSAEQTLTDSSCWPCAALGVRLGDFCDLGDPSSGWLTVQPIATAVCAPRSAGPVAAERSKQDEP